VVAASLALAQVVAQGLGQVLALALERLRTSQLQRELPLSAELSVGLEPEPGSAQAFSTIDCTYFGTTSPP